MGWPRPEGKGGAEIRALSRGEGPETTVGDMREMSYRDPTPRMV